VSKSNEWGRKVKSSFDPEFESWREELTEIQAIDPEFKSLSAQWLQKSVDLNYTYQFEWLGIPIIQLPSDLVTFQEIVWNTKPDLIIECGVARGGSLVFWASIQSICGIKPRVIGIDIDIRGHALKAINSSAFAGEIELVESSSTEPGTIMRVKELAAGAKKVMVVLDSNHTHDHVLSELRAYSSFVTVGNYFLVLDTVIEYLQIDPNRPWGPGASPYSAVSQFLSVNDNFERQDNYEKRNAVSVAPGGFLLRLD
jgi:cephalosporin hydroxylase